jgi:threonyl-tRNA synthetase
MQRKIRDAEVEWIPYIVVIGEKEEKTGKLAVRFRKTGEVKKMDINEIVEMIKKETKEKPFKPLSIPKYLTKRPVFIG